MYGNLDSVDATGIRGWLLDLSNPGRILSIDAYLDDEYLCSGETRIARPDVGEQLGRPVSCGFRLYWPGKRLSDLLRARENGGKASIRVVANASQQTVGQEIPIELGSLREWMGGESNHFLDRYFGRLEAVTQLRICGYAFDRGSLSKPVWLEVLFDGDVVGTVSTGRVRTDLSEHGENIPCGFEWPIPKRLMDGEVRQVDVRVRDDGFVLFGSGARLRIEKLEKQTDTRIQALDLSADQAWVSGWVVDTGSDDPLEVELLVDGVRVAGALAGQYGPDLEDNPDYPYENSFTRFSFPTPALVLDGWPHELRLHVPAWGSKQPANGRIMVRFGECFGKLEHCDERTVSGWVAFRKKPESAQLAVPVEMLVDKRVLASCFLGEERTDIDGAEGFEVALGFRGALGFEVVGPISVLYGAIELQGSPRDVKGSARFDGRLDGVDRQTLSGWAANVDRPDEKVDLDLIVDGQLVATFQPKLPRADVRKALGFATSNVGFSLPTPGWLLDGVEHSLEVRVSATGKPLESRISRVRFPEAFKTLPTQNPHPVLSDFIAHGFRVRADAGRPPLVSVVVLNRNGEDILDAMFGSFVALNSFPRYEFIVVDHASKDSSVAVMERWQRIGVPMTIVRRTFNASFSESNNLAVREYAKGEYVLLLNNDIVFVQDVLADLVATLEGQPKVGMAGAKLLDVVEDRGRNFYPPIQHLGIRYAFFGKQGILPYDEKLSPNSANEAFRPSFPAGVTGAVMICRRSEYIEIGGLDESYFYGYEDVDFCLKYRLRNRQDIVCRNDLQVLHHRGYSRLSGREMAIFERLDRNHTVLMRRWGYAIRHHYRNSLFRGDRIFTSEKLRVAFAVTEIGPRAVAGDYFTALELARALSQFEHVEPVFLSERDGWRDLDRIHVLVVMRHDYDLRAISNPRPDLVTIAWMRNHFESWASQKWFADFDIYLSAAPQFARELNEGSYRCEVFPIATNPETMSKGTVDPALRCVAGFNGSAWNVERQVVKVLESIGNEVPISVIGRGWERSQISAFHRGALPYERMPDFYASTDIVIDDANQSACEWGSANSRVFDALAAGTMVIANSEAASKDLFDGLLPVWKSEEEAVSLIRKYAANPGARAASTQKLQNLVLERHTYRHRAAALLEILRTHSGQRFRIAIKTPVPKREERDWWGDWHFALALKNALKSLGHSVRIDLLSEWDSPTHCDDVVVVLRGLSEYKPKPGQINLLWILSHPESVSIAECGLYDHVFSASPRHAEHLRAMGVDASVLLQCADPDRMKPTVSEEGEAHQHLFVGNSRGKMRLIVSDLLKAGIPLSIYGREWAGLVPEQMVVADLITNSDLPRYYSNAGVVYNDHWPDMARWGFLSNRLFDAAACGAYIVSDDVGGIEDVFDGLVARYRDIEELRSLSSAAAIAGWSGEKANALRAIVVERHTFGHRASEMMRKVSELHSVHLAGSFPERGTTQ